MLSVPVLADIWSGNVVFWNDSAIADLNPGVALPFQPIVLVFANDRRGSISDSFASALAYWNPAFAMSIYSTNDSLASRWSQFGSIAPRSYVVEPGEQQLGAVLVRGLQFLLCPTRGRLTCWESLQAIPYSLTYTTAVFAGLASLPYAQMRNKAGTPIHCTDKMKISQSVILNSCLTAGATVSPSKAAVQSALVEVLDRVTSLALVVDVHNGNLSTSWPVVMFSFVTTQKHVNSSDCNWITYGQQLLAWTQLNEKAISTTEALGFVPLPLAYKRYHHHQLVTISSNLSVSDCTRTG